jgi:hypothetical protein
MGACHVARGQGGSEYSLKDDRALTGMTYETARTAGRRHLLLELGLPTFGLSFAISVLTTYAPVVLIDLVDRRTGVCAAALRCCLGLRVRRPAHRLEVDIPPHASTADGKRILSLQGAANVSPRRRDGGCEPGDGRVILTPV